MTGSEIAGVGRVGRVGRVGINGWFLNRPSTGSGQTVINLLPALSRAVPEVEIAVVTPGADSGSAYHRLLETLPNVTIHPVPTRPGKLGKLLFEQFSFPGACRALGVGLAHVPYFASPLVPPVPTVVTIHDLIPMVLPEYRGGVLGRLYTSLVAAAASRAGAVLTDSESSRRDILARLKVAPERVRVVYLAHSPIYRPLRDEALLGHVRRKYGLPRAFVLYLGGFDRRKNVEGLLRAYTWVLRGLGGDYPLVLAGRLPGRDTRLFPDPLRAARELGMAESVVAPGWIEEADKPALYGAASVFVYPSRYEGFGLPILESMACGTPVVAGDGTSLPELAGDAAYLVAPDDARAMAGAIISLVADLPFRAQMVEAGFRQSARFTWDETARSTLAAYADVLACC